ncbi:MAG: ATP-dependent DNA helicase UvrD2 [Acidimicrobiia bacterium]
MSGSAAPDPLLDDLDPEQRDAVTTPTVPLAIHAPAGSGKTRVLTRRIAWRAREGLHEPSHVLAVTFTRKAAGELTDRLRRLGVDASLTAGTIHSIALAQLRRRALDQGRTPPEVIERKVRLLIPIVGGRGAEATLAATDIAGEIEWAKTQLLRPEAYAVAAEAAGREPSRPFAAVAEVYERYEKEKRKRRLADFEDLVWWCADALERDREFATAQRWRFRHLFVDEFQDTSPAQLRLVRAWLGDRPDLCVVGDPDQSIYAFAGAESGFLSRFGRTFPGGKVIHLLTNYRCSPEIVAAADALLADGGGRRPAVRAASDSGPVPVITEYDDEEAEARGVARLLRDAHTAGTPWSDMAVLYRTNAQSAAFEEAFAKADVPHRVRGAGRFLARPEVKVVLADLRRAATRSPDSPFGALLDTLVGEAVNEERPREHSGATSEAESRRAEAASEARRQYLDAIVRLGHEYLDADGAHAEVDGFLAYLTATLRDDSPAREDAVELLTFHRAKGLEFSTVFVTGLERGLVPIAHADTPAEKAEERRLLYVALTRAGRALLLSRARTRTVGARVANRAPSPWLAVVQASWTGGVPSTPADPRTGLRATRAKLAGAQPGSGDALSPADAALFASLVEWRRRLARASAVPAYVIFNDATLKAVATGRPTSRDALLAIPGIGPVKAERHGDALLELVRADPSGSAAAATRG